jgi:putative acetyltransferase
MVVVERACAPEGFEQFRRLLEEYELGLPADLRVPDLAGELENAESIYAPPSAAFVALADAMPAGSVALSSLDASTAIVKRLYVRPAFRNRGIGRALLSELLSFARTGGYERLVLDTHRDRMPAAYDLYVSFGFSESVPYGELHYGCPTFMELQL